ncbi:hypothetical protein M407DRAFT_101207 [Tulasnella calospora MUT 4182]|uniref:Uncharacterized protein n=1 Tax=Tulasnella calospora MUT 4182 TaxID=1051891 RepID=A0A0C3QG69_9AGAM|nr:hypothetical protein M407DRAFT_101207 [Tulasnella calospora MUT 4182]
MATRTLRPSTKRRMGAPASCARSLLRESHEGNHPVRSLANRTRHRTGTFSDALGRINRSDFPKNCHPHSFNYNVTAAPQRHLLGCFRIS